MIYKILSTILGTLLLCLTNVPTYGAELDSKTALEIENLLLSIKESPCKFKRNGQWYTPGEAGEHIERKFQHVKGKGMIDSAEDFIRYAATRSSITGRKYMVRCPDAQVQPSAQWLRTTLKNMRLRKEKHETPGQPGGL